MIDTTHAAPCLWVVIHDCNLIRYPTNSRVRVTSLSSVVEMVMVVKERLWQDLIAFRRSCVKLGSLDLPRALSWHCFYGCFGELGIIGR